MTRLFIVYEEKNCSYIVHNLTNQNDNASKSPI